LILVCTPLWLFYRAFASVLAWFGLELRASFSELGGNIVVSVFNGSLNAVPFLNGALVTIEALIPDWANCELGSNADMPSVAAA
ncbi:phage tail tape measure protein, partial [Salmonella enterica subsp. enterica serovar Kentucky]